MSDKETLNHRLVTIGENALLIWWSVVILIAPLTIGPPETPYR